MGQFQLDVYGEVLDTLCRSLREGIDVPPHLWSLAKALMGHVQEHWREPDQGLWQVRGPARQFVHSKVMAWVAADRALRLGGLLGADVPDSWRVMRDEVRAQVCRLGWDAGRRSFVQSYGSNRLDAAALLLPGLGFLPAGDARVRDTVGAMGDLLHHGFMRRSASADGLPAARARSWRARSGTPTPWWRSATRGGRVTCSSGSCRSATT